MEKKNPRKLYLLYTKFTEKIFNFSTNTDLLNLVTYYLSTVVLARLPLLQFII